MSSSLDQLDQTTAASNQMRLAAAKRLRKTVLATASRFFFWTQWKDATPLANSSRNPLPFARVCTSRYNGRPYVKLLPATLTSRRFEEHAFGSTPLFVTNDPFAQVWNIVGDIDDDPFSIEAARLQAILRGRGFIAPSRTTGQHVHLLLDRRNVDPETAIARLKRVADVVVRQVQGFEAFKGLPVIARRNAMFLTYDGIVAEAGRVYRVGPHDFGSEIEDLGDAIELRFDAHNSFLVPCVNRSGRSSIQAFDAIDRYVTWRDGAQTITLDELEHFVGLAVVPTPRPLVQSATPSARHKTSSQRAAADARIDALLRACDVEDEQTVGLPGSSRISTLITSADKLRSRMGCAFAVLHQHGGDVEEDLAVQEMERMYVLHGAASDDVLDRKRHNHHRGALRAAKSTFDDSKRRLGQTALDALERQEGGRHRVTPSKIKRLAKKLSPMIHEDRLRHTSLSAVACGILGWDLNLHRHETRNLPSKVIKFRQEQAQERAKLDLRPLDDPGYAIPTATLRGNHRRKKDKGGLLGYFGFRNNGAAVREITQIIVELGGIECTCERFNSGVFDPETGKKIAPGYCRRWRRGEGMAALLEGIHDAADRQFAEAAAQETGEAKSYVVPPFANAVTMKSEIVARRYLQDATSSSRTERTQTLAEVSRF